MITADTLTGAEVMRLRKHYKLSRTAFSALCAFPGSRSDARLMNIETKDSWKDGDHERVAAVLNQVIANGGGAPPPPPAPVAEPVDEAAAVEIDAVSEEDVEWAEADLAYAQAYTDVHPDFALAQAHDGTVEIDARPLEDPTDELFEPNLVEGVERVVADYRMTNSELQTWKRCRRKWWLAWYLELAPALTGDFASARANGIRVHRALAAYYRPEEDGRMDPRDALERVIVDEWTAINERALARGYDEDQLAALGAQFNDTVALDRAMIEGYLEWVAQTGADAELRFVGSEQQVSAYVDLKLEPEEAALVIEVMGIMDARLVRTIDGVRLFMDHKSVSSLTDPVPTLKQNEQMLHYLLLEWLASEDPQLGGAAWCDGALYNMLRRVKRTGTAKPPFFDRVEVPHNVHEIEAYKKRLIGATRDIIRTRRLLDDGADHLEVAYPTPTKTCSWDCDFFAVCNLFDDGSPGVNDMLAAVYERVDPLARYAWIQA